MAKEPTTTRLSAAPAPAEPSPPKPTEAQLISLLEEVEADGIATGRRDERLIQKVSLAVAGAKPKPPAKATSEAQK